MDYYNANGWTLGKGRKVKDFDALARQWKAEDGKNNRLPKQFLGWFKAVYISASPGLQMSVLSDLAAGDRSKAAKIYGLESLVVVRYASGFTVAVNTGKTGLTANLSKIGTGLPEKQSFGAYEFKIWK